MHGQIGYFSQGTARFLCSAKPGRRTTQVDSHANKDKSGKGTQFQPDALTKTLNSALFDRYINFVLSVEELPNTYLASWCEGCDCHEPLVSGMSAYHRAKLFESHYGLGFSSCPCAGMRAPSLAYGRHRDLLQDGSDSVTPEALFGEGPDMEASSMQENSILQGPLRKSEAGGPGLRNRCVSELWDLDLLGNFRSGPGRRVEASDWGCQPGQAHPIVGAMCQTPFLAPR